MTVFTLRFKTSAISFFSSGQPLDEIPQVGLRVDSLRLRAHQQAVERRRGGQGEGSKTIIPKEAFVKLSFRLVPDQNPDEILALVRNHLEAPAPAGVRVEVKIGHSGNPYLTNPRDGYGNAACEALMEAFDREPALIREGSSIPIIQTFSDVLGVDTLLLGLALPDCQIHAPNENFSLSVFEGGIRMSRLLLDAIALA